MPGPSIFLKFISRWTGVLTRFIPNWQRLNVGFKWLWSMALPIDIEYELTLQGINDWAPGSPNASLTALPYIANSRGLIQGEAETADHFALRLINWRTNGLAVAPPATPKVGSQIGRQEVLALQIQQFLGNTPMVRVIERIFSTSGAPTANYVTANPDGTTTTQVAAWDWDSISGFTGSATDGSYAGTLAVWTPSHVYALNTQIISDGANGFLYKATAVAGSHTSGTTEPAFPTAVGGTVIDNAGANQITWKNVGVAPAFTRAFWSDFWVVIYPSTYPQGTSITPLTGQIVPATSRNAILAILAQYKGAHTWCRAIIWSYNATLFDPANPSAAGNPDGTWGNESKIVAGSQVPARNIVDARYWIPNDGG
jgi:hypothetical protein